MWNYYDKTVGHWDSCDPYDPKRSKDSPIINVIIKGVFWLVAWMLLFHILGHDLVIQ